MHPRRPQTHPSAAKDQGTTPGRDGGPPPSDFASRASRAFSLIEVVVASAIAAATVTAGVVIYQSITAAAKPSPSFGSVTVGAAALLNHYDLNQAALDVYYAPTYARRAEADLLKDKFWDDIHHANAVFCLGRSGRSFLPRPGVISLPTGFNGRNIDTPEAFRVFLAAQIPGSALTFTAYRGASTATNASIFILRPSDNAGELLVQAIYEIDLIPGTTAEGGSGTYASVRRYQEDEDAGESLLTDYYDVFYPASDAASVPFNPLVVAFEREARLNIDEGDAIDRLKVAKARPFYFIWWPDPAEPHLEAAASGTFGASDPRASYPAMGGRTSFFFAVPMFPAL